MSWRIHLTNQAIQHLHILPGDEPVLAAWTKPDRVNFYDLEKGTPLGESFLDRVPEDTRRSDAWRHYIARLIGPRAQMYLPCVQTPRTTIYISEDGKMRLYDLRDGNLAVENDDFEQALDTAKAGRFVSLDMDRLLGLIVGLDEQSRLHLYQQNIRVGTFDIGLAHDPYPRALVCVTRGGGSVFATDGRRLVRTDASGRIQREMTMHYAISRIACSPSGDLLITSDMESGVLRLYRGNDLTLTHQRFAIDLVAEASQVQLLADLPPLSTAISAIVASSNDVFAFAMSGVICMSDASHMDKLPRPQPLL